tara:strand:- start:1522 stop:2073 length:552 start_codon:yes stop_codon:yes gene_type:complete
MTHGSLNSPTDKSIHEKTNGQISIDSAKVKYVYKSHFIKEVLHREFVNREQIWKLNMIVRDPIDAISSHVARSRAYTSFLSSKFDREQTIENNIENYLNIISFYKNYSGDKDVILYSDMISGKTINTKFFGSIDFSRQDIRGLAQSSQTSLKGTSKKTIIRDAILTSPYSQTLKFLYDEIISK